ncbi:rod shape-determining protein RodA [Sphingosinicella rhizophila]|uniref:Peptidoglycan glycosyltransferase MrdB n=1 Tax=Sphingosinicella rhizophila TaxID=3050082 RepID=A0ABU3Q334_9SPHN|nr:rod shape-determining protein RodA [Sphingosinicella sp. GR2756]MDT9597815.1 rod shape-determining protein RodA [Sphingosinicella sp. GR2756]
MSFVPAPIAELPWKMLLLICAIAGFGMLILYSAAGGSLTPWALPQGIRFVAFLGMAIVISRFDPEWIKQATIPLYAIILLLLVLVEMLGFVGGGAQRWLDLGFIRIQPSEWMKPVIVLATARFYAALPAAETRRWSAIWPAALLIVFPAALVLVQPDLGTASMIALGGITVMFLAGLPLRLFFGGLALLAVVVPVGYSFLHDYQQKRVLIFLSPESDPLGAGYHISQSKIAIGSGGLFGKGFLNGTQSHLDYLPEGHTDFIFATMAEEWGLAGGLLLILAFMLVIKWGIGVALDSKDRFSRLTAAGLTTTIFFYVAINLMMVMGLAPVVGIPLPLVSYGGSAMLTIMLCLGVLMSIDRHNRRDRRYG